LGSKKGPRKKRDGKSRTPIGLCGLTKRKPVWQYSPKYFRREGMKVKKGGNEVIGTLFYRLRMGSVRIDRKKSGRKERTFPTLKI